MVGKCEWKVISVRQKYRGLCRVKYSRGIIKFILKILFRTPRTGTGRGRGTGMGIRYRCMSYIK